MSITINNDIILDDSDESSPRLGDDELTPTSGPDEEDELEIDESGEPILPQPRASETKGPIPIVKKITKTKELAFKILSKKDLVMPDRMLMVGPSQTGKSSLIRTIIKLYQATGKICAVYWYGANALKEKLPRARMRTYIDKDQLTALRGAMKKIMKRTTQTGSAERYAIVVLDDILSESFDDAWWSDFISTCRHDNIILLIGLQYIKKVPPVIRENINRLWLTRSNNQTLKALYELSCEGSNFYEWCNKVTSGMGIGKPCLLDFRIEHEEINFYKVPYTDSL
jgi:hypothetical protein